MNRAYYSDSISTFLNTSAENIVGALTTECEFDVQRSQSGAWREEIAILRRALCGLDGSIYFEYSIPRMGRRIDVVLLIGPAILVLEFKIGERDFPLHALNQVWFYAFDLKNFHEPSHNCVIAPILIASEADSRREFDDVLPQNDGLFLPIKTNGQFLRTAIDAVLSVAEGVAIDRGLWESGRYCPTPTIIDAALDLYAGHSVADISRSDADQTNRSQTSKSISAVIERSKAEGYKSICFVTGVPGAGKTLVGLDMAAKHNDRSSDLHSVFLSGNGPLVKILHEALTRDKVRRARDLGGRLTKQTAKSDVKAFIQNVHNYRDEYAKKDRVRPPVDHVVIFDEAQRAWNLKQTSKFMRQKKGVPDFSRSEPEFLISCLARHPDWAVIICLVGGGQEINTGEAGIKEWIEALVREFPKWHIYISPHLSDSEYAASGALDKIRTRTNVLYKDELHLAVSMRSFRAENVSLLVKQLLDLEIEAARKTLETVRANYPMVISRDLVTANNWLRDQAQESDRYGMVASSQAERLKPHAINVKAPLDPVHWFLEGRDDVRSSYFLEDAATEFDVQGLELDWTCVAWDADLRYSTRGWEHWSFRGSRWVHINQEEDRNYLKNAYRVLLTRARQGMVIVVPPGDPHDATRSPGFYNSTFDYLRAVGFEAI